MRLIIVSGLSGSGKSIVLNALEDMGYYCVDNLPLSLLPDLISEFTSGQTRKIQNTAVGIDSRNLAQLDRFPQLVAELESAGHDVETVFLQADDQVLLKRFSETRRRHPLSGVDVALAEAILKEREFLQPVFANADLQIDTSHTNVHDLRRLVQHRIGKSKHIDISLLFESFGYKHGVPSDADIIFDVRCLPNPHWEADLRPFTGKDQAVVSFLEKHAEVEEMYQDISGFLQKWLQRFQQENRSYMTIAVGCTGGQHRSVYMVHRLAEQFRNTGNKNVMERHRELL